MQEVLSLKRDMDLCRKILFKIEEQYIDTALSNLELENYDNLQIAYHCKILNEAGLIDFYNAQYADNSLYFFSVGSLTWEGHDFLDKIREDTTWNNVKKIIKDKALPFTLEVAKTIATDLLAVSMKAALNL